MKPYGREKKIKGCGQWKHGTWWHEWETTVPRTTLKANIRKEVEEDTRTMSAEELLGDAFYEYWYPENDEYWLNYLK